MHPQTMGLGIMLYMTLLGMTMVLIFIESRLPVMPSAAIVYTVTALLIAVEIALFRWLGLTRTARLSLLVISIPATAVFFFLSRHRGWRLVFQMTSAILFCSFLQHIAGVAYFAAGQRLWMFPAAYAVLTPLCIWLLSVYLRPLVAQSPLKQHHGWRLVCMAILLYYGIITYLIPGYVGVDFPSTLVKPAISLLMAGFYCLLLQSLSFWNRVNETSFRAEMSVLSLSGLQNWIEGIFAAEEAVRIERHDLRHRLQIISELVAQGNSQEALSFIGSAQKQLDELQPVHWCHPPVLDAVFSAYFQQAKHHSIRLHTHISLPRELPVNEAELAIVFANALENAIHACLRFPPEAREIRCKVIGHPNVMFELSNPCTWKVRFDGQGLPLSPKTGHGIGCLSIASFCQKHGAFYQFSAINGQFVLRIIL